MRSSRCSSFTAAHTDSSIDPWTDDTLYATLSILGPKLRLVTFEAPEALVECKNTGNLGWEWSFAFELHMYKWERSATSLLGGDRAYTLSVVSRSRRAVEDDCSPRRPLQSMKPDPDFPVCIFSPASKRKPAAVQLLDYNLSVSPFALRSAGNGTDLLLCSVSSQG